MIKIYLINFLIKLNSFFSKYFFINSMLIKFINYLGGPLFVKLFQAFYSFDKLEYSNENGSIGKITYQSKLVRKDLHNNINKNMVDSLNLFKQFLIINNIKFPFYYKEFYDINLEQIDMKKEKEYSVKLTEVFKNIKNVKVINIIYAQKTYHISDLIKGQMINLFLKKEENKKYEKDIFRLLYLSYYLMLSTNNFHCDWHYGNFLVDVNENDDIILYILDTGLMGSLKNIEHFNKLKILLKTNMLKPEPINLIKFLCFINQNKEANIKEFIKMSKEKLKVLEPNKEYKLILLELVKFSSIFDLKYPIIILYMFQSIIFLNNIDETIQDDILASSKRFGFYQEIKKHVN